MAARVDYNCRLLGRTNNFALVKFARAVPKSLSSGILKKRRGEGRIGATQG